MCSIRNLSALGLLAGLLIGCQRVQPPVSKHVALAPEPAPDLASVHRAWPAQTATVPTGAVVAGTTRFPYALGDETPEYKRVWRDPILFLAQVPVVPFTYLYTAPFTPRTYQGVAIQPSSTAMPRLPDSPDQSLTGRTDSGKPVPTLAGYQNPAQ